MAMCAVIVTDSGSIVEEANVLEVPCVTLRFGSDRSETFLAGSNFLAPPIDKALMTSVIHNVFEHRAELSWDRVYPEKASAMLVDAVEREASRAEESRGAWERRQPLRSPPPVRRSSSSSSSSAESSSDSASV